MKLMLHASDYIIMIQVMMHAIFKYTFWEFTSALNKPTLIEFLGFLSFTSVIKILFWIISKNLTNKRTYILYTYIMCNVVNGYFKNAR
jgi:hypothetical protein